jgi:signal transduction histidine kinase
LIGQMMIDAVQPSAHSMQSRYATPMLRMSAHIMDEKVIGIVAEQLRKPHRSSQGCKRIIGDVLGLARLLGRTHLLASGGDLAAVVGKLGGRARIVQCRMALGSPRRRGTTLAACAPQAIWAAARGFVLLSVN